MLTRRRSGPEEGFTLVELLVVVGIMTIIGGIVGGTIIQSMRTGRQADARIHSLNDLQRTLQRVGRELRSGGCPERVCAVELPPIEVDPGGDFDSRVTTNVHRDGQLHVYTYHWSETPGDPLLRDHVAYDPMDLANPILEVQDEVVLSDVAAFELAYYDGSFEDGPDPDDDDDPMACGASETLAHCIARFQSTMLRIEIRAVKQLAEQDDQEAKTHVTIRNAR